MKFKVWLQKDKYGCKVYGYKYATNTQPYEHIYIAGRRTMEEIEPIIDEVKLAECWSDLQQIKQRYRIKRRKRR